MRRFTLLNLLAALVASIGAPVAVAKTVTSTATGGDFNAPTSWNGPPPGPADDAVILAGASMVVVSGPPQNVKSLNFSNNGANTTTLTVDSGATLNVSGSVTLDNAAATNTSAIIQGAGTLTCEALAIGGTTTPTPSGSDFTATLTSTISNLNISGTLTVSALYNSSQAAANQGTFAISSGAVSANGVTLVTVPFFGPTLTLATGTQNGTLIITGSAPFNITGGGSSTFTPNGTNATVIYAAGGQTVYAATYQNLTLTNNGPKTISGVTVNGVLSMQGTATASVAPTYGTNATLQYAGSGPQSQRNGPELTLTIPNLWIANTNGVTLTNSATVGNLLTLANGKLITGTNRLIVGTNGSVSGGGTNSYVAGNLQKNFSVGTQSFSFPIGNGEFAPLILSNILVTTAGGVIASTTNVLQQDGASGINTNQMVDRFWTLTNSGGSFGSYGATFNYPAADVDAGASPAQFSVSKLSAGTWSSASVSGTPTSNAASISGESGFGTFAIGDPTNMPVELFFTSINGGASPQVGTPFNVTIQSQDSGGTAGNVTQNTSVTLNLQAGSGVLGGTLSGTILAGSSSVTITGVTYSVAQGGVKLGAAVTSGEALTNTVSTAFTVNPGNQTITFPSPGNQTYGVAPITLAATASSGLPVSYSVTSGPATVSSGVLTITGVGSVTVQATQSGSGNWNAATPVSQTIPVAQKSVTGSFTAKNKTYDGTTTATVATTNLSGVINSDVVNLTVGSAAFTDKNAGNGKTVIASGLALSGANAGNYTLTSTFATNTANISAATLTVTANNTNQVYGAANPAFTVTYGGFVNGDTASVLSGAPLVTTSATTNSPVPGSPYPITAAQGTLSAANYSFAFVSGNLTVTPATLTVTANSISRSYGATNPELDVTYSGFVNGEDTNVLSGAPLVTTTAGPGSPVPGSPYSITVSQGTLSATNYTFNFVNGNLMVTSVILTVTANDTNRTYGAANPAFTFNCSGFVNGDGPGVLSGAPLIATSAGAGSSVAGSPYPIVVTQGSLSATNYTFAFVNGNLAITPATLTVSADNQWRPFGGTNPVLTASYSGFVNGETTNVLSGAPALSTTADTNSAPGTYPIQIAAGTLNATNYVFSFNNGTLTVNSLPPILTIQLVTGPTNAVILSTVGLAPNTAYQILGSTDMINWAEIGAVQSAGDGSLLFTNAIASPTQFYRTLGP